MHMLYVYHDGVAKDQGYVGWYAQFFHQTAGVLNHVTWLIVAAHTT